MIVLGIMGLKNVLKNKGFTEPQKTVTALKDYEAVNDSVVAFLKDTDTTDIINHESKYVYDLYIRYCIDNGLKTTRSAISVSMDICKRLVLKSTVKTINGKSTRILERI